MDIYQTVTDKIVAMIEAGAGEWRMPWHGEGLKAPRNPLSGTQYRGINVPLLWAAAEQTGHTSQLWATYKQWSAAGAQVRKGEKSQLVFFWKRLDRADAAQDADEGEGVDRSKTRFVARSYSVFAVEQVDGYELVPQAPNACLNEFMRIASAEAFFCRTGATVRVGGDKAFYSPSRDVIQMPEFSTFFSAEDYYSTLGHEHVHWTKQPQRCNREFSKRFGDQAYAFEELVAELGAAFLCAGLGISNEPRPDHAAYITNWLTVLKNDKHAIFAAGSRAQTAVDYLYSAVTSAELAA